MSSSPRSSQFIHVGQQHREHTHMEYVELLFSETHPKCSPFGFRCRRGALRKIEEIALSTETASLIAAPVGIPNVYTVGSPSGRNIEGRVVTNGNADRKGAGALNRDRLSCPKCARRACSPHRKKGLGEMQRVFSTKAATRAPNVFGKIAVLRKDEL